MCFWPRGPGYTAVTGDVTCAFFHAEEEEEVYVDPPTEWKGANGHEWAWKLEKQLYGRRPAPRKFSDKVASVMCQELKMLRCQEVPHLYFHPIKKVAVEVHVDDFYAVGPGNAPWEVMTELKKFLTLSLEGPFSAGESFVHLKRKRVITEDGVWIAPSDSQLLCVCETGPYPVLLCLAVLWLPPFSSFYLLEPGNCHASFPQRTCQLVSSGR